MSNSLGLYLALRCGLCDRLMEDEKQRQTAIRVRLFGAAAYATCPICGLEADPEDPEWRAKVDEFLRSEYPDDIRY